MVLTILRSNVLVKLMLIIVIIIVYIVADNIHVYYTAEDTSQHALPPRDMHYDVKGYKWHNIHHPIQESNADSSNKFRDLNNTYAFTLHDVCIQDHNSDVAQNRLALSVTLYDSILAHQSVEQVTFYHQPLSLLPSGAKFLNDPLFIVNTKVIKNIHHNMDDLGVPYFYMLNKTGLLGGRVFLVYTGHPSSSRTIDADGNNLYPLTHNLLKVLSANHQILPAIRFKDKMCFRNAVFYKSAASTAERIAQKASKWNSVARRQMAEYIMNKLEITYDKIKCRKSKLVTIVDRTWGRKIMNIGSIIKSITSQKLANVSLANVDRLTIPQQVQLVHCSDVYVGIHDTALQWAMFLRKGTTLIEIAWPKNHLTFKFTSERFKYDKHIYKLQLEVPKDNLMVDHAEKETDMLGNTAVKMEDSDKAKYQHASVLLKEKTFIEAITKALNSRYIL